MIEMSMRIENRATAQILVKALAEIKCEIFDEHGEIYIVFERDYCEYSGGEQAVLNVVRSLTAFPENFRKLDKYNKARLRDAIIELTEFIYGR